MTNNVFPRARADRGELIPVTVAVIGAGPGGIAMGIQLAAGRLRLHDLRPADGFGGTWRNNTYPGRRLRRAVALLLVLVRAEPAVEQDVRHSSRRSWPIWSRWPPSTASAEPSASAAPASPSCGGPTTRSGGRSRPTTARRTSSTPSSARSGCSTCPTSPTIPGADRFRGRTFHSSDWDHAKSTAGERVASIGTGASAIQYVPEIAPEAAHLTVFQRTPDLGEPALRRAVHPRAAGALRTRSRRGAQGARRGVRGVRSGRTSAPTRR